MPNISMVSTSTWAMGAATDKLVGGRPASAQPQVIATNNHHPRCIE